MYDAVEQGSLRLDEQRLTSERVVAERGLPHAVEQGFPSVVERELLGVEEEDVIEHGFSIAAKHGFSRVAEQELLMQRMQLSWLSAARSRNYGPAPKFSRRD
ncbi:hypothetical protein PC111_g5080 [Phytophthora cactorum]|nr:hypothetical protein PC111_g5080 [Phytophthora cactorum]KAG3079701.1 hypothetical protein PC121_g6896 [Phytophthora cactorum]KAG3087592.1 hypothetical protein PC122_g8756 [Phytophthora cactorum]KAG3200940.1 hypothetical protein PC128_g4244 [Phytophthora cactorum]